MRYLDWRDTFKEQSIISPKINDLFDMDPLMLTSVIVIGGTGLLSIGLARLERWLALRDDDRAIYVDLAGKIIFIGGFIFGFFHFLILHNPLWMFFR